MNTSYMRYELLRTFRNRRYFLLAIGFPLVLYFLVAGPNRHESSLGGTGIPAPLYFMVGLAGFGAMSAVISAGGRIANERSVGWIRQLRLTPLSTRDYFRAKIATAYMSAMVTVVLLYLAGVTLGVHLSAAEWLRMTVLLLIALIPFAALGVLLGHLLNSDSIGPAVGGITALFALLGGTWFPITSGLMHDIAEAMPSFWLVQASHVAIGGRSWGATAWFVIAGWTALLAALAVWAYRRDTQRG